MKLRARELFLISLPIIIAALFSYYLQGLILTNKEEFAAWLASFGPFVILVYAILQAVTVIIAPLGGFVLIVGMIALYGPAVALAIAYFVVTPCYLINFYLARRYGRPFVERIIGKPTMTRIDHFVEDAGLSTLILLRLLQGGNFDYFAYGLGLTKISFKTFVWVNILVGIPSTFVIYLIMSSFDNLTFGVITFYATTGILGGLSIYLNHYLKKHRKAI